MVKPYWIFMSYKNDKGISIHSWSRVPTGITHNEAQRLIEEDKAYRHLEIVEEEYERIYQEERKKHGNK